MAKSQIGRFSMSDVFTTIYQDAIKREDELLKTFLDAHHLKDEKINTLSEVLRVRETQIKRACTAIVLMKENPDRVNEIYEKWDLGYEIELEEDISDR